MMGHHCNVNLEELMLVLQLNCCHQTHSGVSNIICKAIPFALNAYYYGFCALLFIVPHTFKFKVSIFAWESFSLTRGLVQAERQQQSIGDRCGEMRRGEGSDHFLSRIR